MFSRLQFSSLTSGIFSEQAETKKVKKRIRPNFSYKQLLHFNSLFVSGLGEIDFWGYHHLVLIFMDEGIAHGQTRSVIG
ncbi:hypothetical protein [Acinetobacter gyllenbergii]|uniref:hypothetical protein n=1 Tax=Acinetobacter gyllenbergii TaxID=134534 RepID=UPI003F56681A